MKAHPLYLWEKIRGSYWFVPSLMAVGAIALAVGMIALDGAVSYGVVREIGWIYTGGPDGARAVLSVVASSMITVAGVVFSITIVALALASGQFGPRLLAKFMRDTANQVVLGTFTSTFLYCLLVLRTIRTGDEGAAFVPYLSVSVGVVLGLLSLGVLIFFINHVAVSIQVFHLIETVTETLHHSIDDLFPRQIGRAAPERRVADDGIELPGEFESEARTVTAEGNGYIEAVDDEGLMEIATEHDLLLRLEYRPGGFVMRGNPLVRVWPGERLDEALAEHLRDAFALGPQRTPIQDVEFSVNQLVEIALRALSPSVNDPFTAINCIDQLGAGLGHLAERDIPSAYRFDSDGRLRVVASSIVTFRGVTDTAFNEIRQNAAHHTSVRIRLLETIAMVIRCVQDTGALDALLRQADMIRRGSADAVPEAEDRKDIEQRYRAVQQAVERQRRTLATPEAKQPV